jgi:hypothetical protein
MCVPLIKKATFALLFGLSISSFGDARIIHLAFDPGKTIEEAGISPSKAWLSQVIKIDPFIDKRQTSDNNVIGQRVNNKSDYYWTKENIADWATRFTKYSLSKAGLNVAETGHTVILQSYIEKFFVAEGSVYNGYVEISFNLVDLKGNIIWNGTILDSSSWWGDTYAEKEFLHAIGNSFLEVLDGLIANNSAQQALVSLSGSQDEELSFDVNEIKLLNYSRPIDAGIRGKKPPNIGQRLTVVGGVVAGVGAGFFLLGPKEPIDIRFISIPFFIVGGVAFGASVPFWVLSLKWDAGNGLTYVR